MTFQYFILIGLFQNGPERCLIVLKPLVVSKQAVECSDSVVWNRHNFTSKLPAIIFVHRSTTSSRRHHYCHRHRHHHHRPSIKGTLEKKHNLHCFHIKYVINS